ncbi:MAG: lysogenization regulator HflD [Alteromonadaceae bacterium]|nr:MAG: lysogenization regulator HflD [Alteromonadaceae bacterium]
MATSWRNITIALAGAIQAISLVEEVAKTSHIRQGEFATAIGSLFETTPTSTEAVFGGLHNINSGLQLLKELLNNHKAASNADAVRYLLGILYLQRRLDSNKDLLSIISSRLKKVEDQTQHFDITHDTIVANIADLYSDTISKFRYRIQVTGDPTYLQQQRVANQIRSMLLAAIRAAMLWRQVGGSRWQLLLQRNKILEECELLLESNANTQA